MKGRRWEAVIPTHLAASYSSSSSSEAAPTATQAVSGVGRGGVAAAAIAGGLLLDDGVQLGEKVRCPTG